MAGKYIGVLLCADCAGVWTEVTLTDPGPNTGLGSGTFVMTERFTGGVHGGNTITTRGSWSTIARDEPYTGKLELRGERRNGGVSALRYFYCYHGAFLRVLDAVGNPIATLKDTLQRVIPAPRPEFGPLTESESHAVIMGQVGDEFEIALPAHGHDTLTAWSMVRPTSANMMLETTYGGSLFTLSGEFSFFILKSVAPGKVSVKFQNSDNPTRTASFNFEISPDRAAPLKPTL